MAGISKNRIKQIKALDSKKGRKSFNAFLAEGPKVVEEFLGVFEPLLVVHTPQWKPHLSLSSDTMYVEVTDEELRKTSLLQHPREVLAIFKQPKRNDQDLSSIAQKELILALDGIQDPGNMGTIIRIADWFGIKHILCSPDSADVYNPKVVQATMGSLARVNIYEIDLATFLHDVHHSTPIYGTLLDGNSIYEANIEPHGIIVLGNEGNGISEVVRSYITHPIRIPSYPTHSSTAESLNVAIATAITCAEFRRQQQDK